MNKPILPTAEESSLAHYLKEIGRLQPLSSEKEAELAAKIKKGEQTALDQLVKANLRFVVSVARNYQNQGLSLCDLINEGNMGLVRAARRFDEKKNFRFISYAVWWIRQAILQSLAEHSRIMRLPLNRAGAIHKINKTQIELEQRFNRVPDIEEIARELSISETAVRETISIANRHISLDAPVRDNDGSTLLDLLGNQLEGNSPEDKIQALSLNEEIRRMLDTLTEREREIIKLYFGIGHEAAFTLDEIGRRFNITRERVRQIKSKALSRLKSSPTMQVLKSRS
ncbi:RNA polymerase sigma factor RpoD/SigA [Chitinispirillales bacterium ANBcel5]|uniref:sigma-70 family RNA polymerase sigma factor n=1 Tax=Cellulosispirillum alkaliphilum TaxID=3039283 RepID=UPI002A4E7976|nr:RNA polymerase sigma factor RpoD/SigA [Chitinispirillales bacterium ANBcel5]